MRSVITHISKVVERSFKQRQCQKVTYLFNSYKNQDVSSVRPADELIQELDKVKVNVSDTPLKTLNQPKLATGNLLCATRRGKEAATSKRRVE